MSVLAATPSLYGHAGFSTQAASSCRRSCEGFQQSTPPPQYVARKRVWDDGELSVSEAFGRTVRARLADVFEHQHEKEAKYCTEEESAHPHENSHLNAEMETLADAFQVLMGADPLEVDGISCPCCRTTEPRNTKPCTYCMKAVCTSCLRPCEICNQDFCSSCSTINYDLRHERELCFSCNEEHSH